MNVLRHLLNKIKSKNIYSIILTLIILILITFCKLKEKQLVFYKKIKKINKN